MYKAEACVIFTDNATDTTESQEQPTWGMAYDEMSRRLGKLTEKNALRDVEAIIIRINKVS